MGYLISGKPEECYGCRVCAEACVKGCISFYTAEDGFVYPQIDADVCVNCNACVNVCPYNGLPTIIKQVTYRTKAIAAVNRDSDVLRRSSSGGAFPAIVKNFFEQNPGASVYGVRFSDDLRIVNDVAYDNEQAVRFSKSKYVQSDTNGCFGKAKEDLNAGKEVLFCGVPCQVAALRSFLKHDYRNLTCIDLVCHGVPSQQLFDKYIAETTKKLKKQIKAYYFRNKMYRTNHMTNSTVLIETSDGQKIVRDAIDDPFLRAYHARLIYRTSCYHCRFACESRQGDVTLADAYGIESQYSDLDIRSGVSLVLINSEKGDRLVSGLSKLMEVREMDYSLAIASNGCLQAPTKEPAQRKAFFELMKTSSFESAVKRIVRIRPVSRLLRLIFSPEQIESAKKAISRK